jgi:predicted O-methyltransferase YrrM
MNPSSYTIEDPKVTKLLNRLYAQAAESDPRVMPQARAAADAQGEWDTIKLAPYLDQAFMAIAPEVGRLFYLLVRMHKPKLVVEFGASYGVSAIHVAAALRDNGFGRMITTEQSDHKVQQAGANLAEAGLADLVEIYHGDAFQTLANVPAIDLLILDGWKGLYLPLLKQLEPRLSKGSLVIADDTISLKDEMGDYLAYIRNPANGYISSEVPIDDGFELSIR